MLVAAGRGFAQCSVGAQVNIIDEDGNGSADESLSGGRNEYEPADNERARDDSSSSSPTAASQNFGETDKELVASSCQTRLIQRPIQALMGVH